MLSRSHLQILLRCIQLRGPLAADPTAQMLHLIVLALALWYGFWTVVLLPLYPGAAAKLPAVLLQEAGPVAALILLRSGFLRAASLAYLSGTWAFTTLVVAMDGGIRSPVQLFYATLPVLATWLVGYAEALWTAGICLLSALAFAIVEAVGMPLPRVIHTTPFGLWAIQLQVIVIGAVPVAQILRALHRRTGELKALVEEKSVLLREVEESEERFHTLADHMAQLAWMADGSGQVFWWNRRWIEFTGVALGGTVSWGQIMHPEYAQPVTERMLQSFRSGELWEDVFPIRAKDGSFRWFLTRAHAIRNREGEILRWFGTSTDITDQKNTEAALRRSNEDLRQFAYVASHDLREPLRNVSNYTELLARSSNNETLSGVREKSIEIIVTAARRMEALITAILQYARVATNGSEVKTYVDLNEVLGETLADLEGLLVSAQVEVKHGHLPGVLANRFQMGQLFQNLVSNAIRFRHPDRRLHIEISVEARVDFWQFAVRDNGQGFKQEYADRIFEIFKRLHGANVEGTGIGLAVCKAVVESHGGNIWAVGRPGEGADFYFSLPRNP